MCVGKNKVAVSKLDLASAEKAQRARSHSFDKWAGFQGQARKHVSSLLTLHRGLSPSSLPAALQSLDVTGSMHVYPQANGNRRVEHANQHGRKLFLRSNDQN